MNIGLAHGAMGALIQDGPLPPRLLGSYSAVPRGQFVWHGQCPDASAMSWPSAGCNKRPFPFIATWARRKVIL